MQFIEYPKCSTCKNAKKFLEERKISFVDRNIVTDTPRQEELRLWQQKFKIPIKKFFNTSGLKYKQLNLKEKLSNMSDDEKIELLSSNGMLIKRPLLVDDNFILIGFKEDEWSEIK